jgi:hypothetical protein
MQQEKTSTRERGYRRAGAVDRSRKHRRVPDGRAAPIDCHNRHGLSLQAPHESAARFWRAID